MTEKPKPNYLKIAIAHDFLFQDGGAEKVVAEWLKAYPQADVYTAFAFEEKFLSSPAISLAFKEGRIKTTAIQYLFNIKIKDQNGQESRLFAPFTKHLFWLYPILMKFVTINNYYAVLISSTDCAKQVRLNNCHKIVHYCHTPTRYLHNLVNEDERANLPLILKLILPIFIFCLRPLDLNAVDYLNKKGSIWIANSSFIQAMIWDKYKTKSSVIYPPVETTNFNQIVRKPYVDDEQFYLCHGRISFHKRIDVAIRACLMLSKKLKISGTSALISDIEYLKQIVSDFERDNPNKAGLIEFLGRTDDKKLIELMEHCRAFIFPTKEDAGISPIEMMAAGVPVIAYKAGGALEYIKPNINGIFFDEQTPESLGQAIEEFEKIPNWNEEKIKKSAEEFDSKIFIDKIKAIIV
jgi:glycosyltransferase involved in cell wall biosynthesis